MIKYSVRSTFFKPSVDSIIAPDEADVLSQHEFLKDAITAQKNSKVPCFVYDEVYDIPLYWHSWFFFVSQWNENTVPSGAD